ncbi:MAG: UDP-N-acetylglucosamine 2-epimerase (non-hydrolyzing) [Bdellovibrionales bacterium CG11_big_fil_rev_8_21_14_0_20_38_13]|nr:MAG: UDP-N-acetylglucosamine 2-epimerase (non-hydrolyzing) [Bdellovibrionales bacterium CG22_combo_CG10-13_8_21_14_all_38_13]PIR30907.1 MAG: UDP-N-acetylglucosamine 2-epimerase (non-hydrolyzing) [Bdellovibrionales bacterium CG11_big_fil_rev_8_21_14_0_20_38_13]
MIKLMTIVGTRPEIIKLSRIIAACDKYFKQTLVHTGQNYDYELNEVFFNDLNVRKPDFFMGAAMPTAGQTIAQVISKSDELLRQERPDALLLYGDTNSCLSVISAKRLQIPIFHMEAGNRCFDQRVPEEINRKIVDHLSDINMVHSEHARRYLISEGLRPEHIIKTGSPMKEVLNSYSGKIDECDVLNRLSLKKDDFFLVSIHREENVDYPENLNALLDSLEAVAQKYKKKIIVSTHPRTRKKLEEIPAKNLSNLIDFMKPMGFIDYNRLQKEAFCVLSDSGTITEESSMLKFPAVMIRQAHERPEGMDVGTVIMSGLSKDRVLESIEIATNKLNGETILDIEDYSSSQVSSHVVKVIQSYTDYINRVVWKKSEKIV